MIDGEYSTQGWNRFSYVKNNPVRYKDPTGHENITDKETKTNLRSIGLNNANGGNTYYEICGPNGVGTSVGKNYDDTAQKNELKSKDEEIKKRANDKNRVDLCGGVLNDKIMPNLKMFAKKYDLYLKSSMGNDRSATRNLSTDDKTSQHYTGNAFDMIAYDSKKKLLSVEKLADLAKQSKLFHGIEISKVQNFVHVDMNQQTTKEKPKLFEQVQIKPYKYKYYNESTYWRDYEEGKYIKYNK